MEIARLLFEILRSEVNGESLSADRCRGYDPQQLYTLAKSHDRMYCVTDALDKVNHLRQLDRASGRNNTVERLGQSLEVAKAFLADTKAERRIDQMSGAIDALRQVSDPSGLMAAAGPLLSELRNMKDFERK